MPSAPFAPALLAQAVARAGSEREQALELERSDKVASASAVVPGKAIHQAADTDKDTHTAEAVGWDPLDKGVASCWDPLDKASPDKHKDKEEVVGVGAEASVLVAAEAVVAAAQALPVF
jgi:hypothetical protein